MTCDISREYFDWVCGFVYSANAYRKNYHFSKLLSRLYETDFYWLLDDDANRAADGDVLRYRFMDARYPSAPPVKFFDENRRASLRFWLVYLLGSKNKSWSIRKLATEQANGFGR